MSKKKVVVGGFKSRDRMHLSWVVVVVSLLKCLQVEAVGAVLGRPQVHPLLLWWLEVSCLRSAMMTNRSNRCCECKTLFSAITLSCSF